VTMTESAPENRILESDFKPAWWLGNRHAQTIYPSFPWSGAPRLHLRNEVLELPDGDVTTVDWMIEGPGPDSGAPILIILHGLEGSADSAYARIMLQAAAGNGWRAAVLHFRDCGDYRNRLPRRYHAGETNDIRYFLERLRTTGHEGPMMAVGYSLGGNVLLKYLGENGASTPLDAAAAVSAPLDLHDSARALTYGFSRVYQYHLLKRMKSAVTRKFDQYTAAFDWHRTMKARTFAEFDDAVTAPLHGFSGKDEYYDRCSAMGYLASIRRPTLIINSLGIVAHLLEHLDPPPSFNCCLSTVEPSAVRFCSPPKNERRRNCAPHRVAIETCPTPTRGAILFAICCLPRPSGPCRL
jgi:hypothetical protein